MNGNHLNTAPLNDPDVTPFVLIRKRHRSVAKVAEPDNTKPNGKPIATEKSKTLVELIEMIAAALVDDPESIEVSTVHGNSTLIFELKVAKADLGKVIGRNGRTADAIRHLLASVGTKYSKRTLLQIIE